jgi:hypothetical protein
MTVFFIINRTRVPQQTTQLNASFGFGSAVCTEPKMVKHRLARLDQ